MVIFIEMNNIHLYEHQKSQWMQSPSHPIYHFVNLQNFENIFALFESSYHAILRWGATYLNEHSRMIAKRVGNFMSLTTMRTKVESQWMSVYGGVWMLGFVLGANVQFTLHIVSIIMVVESDKLYNVHALVVFNFSSLEFGVHLVLCVCVKIVLLYMCNIECTHEFTIRCRIIDT